MDRIQRRIVSGALMLFILGAPLTLKGVVLPKEKFKALKQESCVFIHVWAQWCTICIEEMPQVIAMLRKQKKVKPILVDVSSPSEQKKVSIEWMKKQKPPFPTYEKPPGSDSDYMTAIDPQWSGALPFTVLYDKGKKLAQWTSRLDIKQVRVAFRRCQQQ